MKVPNIEKKMLPTLTIEEIDINGGSSYPDLPTTHCTHI